MEFAVLMASGMGTRMLPLTENIPKPLIKVAGKPMIETLIDGLECRGVARIYIVIGYLGEQFNYLERKYSNVQLIKNPDFATVNNISSVYYACDVIRNTNCFICEADLFVADPSIFEAELQESCYYGKMVKGHSEDWIFELDAKGFISKIRKVGDDKFNMVGISYLIKEDVNLLADAIQATYNTKGYEVLFWDEVVDKYLQQIKLQIYPVKEGQIVEIDTVKELEEANDRFSSIQ